MTVVHAAEGAEGSEVVLPGVFAGGFDSLVKMARQVSSEPAKVCRASSKTKRRPPSQWETCLSEFIGCVWCVGREKAWTGNPVRARVCVY